jgi:hypothetical protein
VLIELLLPLALDRGPCSGQALLWRPDAPWTGAVPNVAREVSVCDADGKAVARLIVDARPPRPAADVRTRLGRQRVLVPGDSYVGRWVTRHRLARLEGHGAS